jgi:hypothetical protein
MNEELERLRKENDRLKAEKVRSDDERWEEVKVNMAHIPKLVTDLEELKVSINGCPEEPDKGMKVRVDRLEQSEKRRSAIIAFLATSTVGLAINALWVRFTGKAP